MMSLIGVKTRLSVLTDSYAGSLISCYTAVAALVAVLFSYIIIGAVVPEFCRGRVLAFC